MSLFGRAGQTCPGWCTCHLTPDLDDPDDFLPAATASGPAGHDPIIPPTTGATTP